MWERLCKLLSSGLLGKCPNDNLIGNSFWKVSVICTVELEEVRTFVRNIDSWRLCTHKPLSDSPVITVLTECYQSSDPLLGHSVGHQSASSLASLCNVWKLGKHTSWEGQHSQSNNLVCQCHSEISGYIWNLLSHQGCYFQKMLS